MNSIEKLKTERNQVREILSMLTSDFQDEFSDKDFEHMNKVLDLINTDEKLIDDLCEENNEAKTIIKLLLWDLRNRDWDCTKDIEKAEEFLDGFDKRTN